MGVGVAATDGFFLGLMFVLHSQQILMATSQVLYVCFEWVGAGVCFAGSFYGSARALTGSMR